MTPKVPHTPDLLYLHLVLANIDGELNILERMALRDVVRRFFRALDGDRVSEIYDAATATLRATRRRAEHFVRYEEALQRVFDQTAEHPEQRRTLLKSLVKLAHTDGRQLDLSEVAMLRSAARILALPEAIAVSENGRSVSYHAA